MMNWAGLRRAAALGLALLTAGAAPPVTPPTFGHAVLVERDGTPQLQVDGQPFFFFGGAFFYERLPTDQWRTAMLAMRDMGANTLDLYVPWNWHELADGSFDFDGRTNPRRNLREVLRLGKELGFFFIVRPGPVIRNEWRNGGYPAWLLRRPEYGMPLHDVLEGRYPATATLQNANSEDAAAQWLANSTHRVYAARWLRTALRQFAPVADRVLAVQLDDDQGAYIDNDTYPAPHLHAYLDWLRDQVRSVVGPRTPVFINTYDMKVPASSPVWAMGNWYQSDAERIGAHDRIELDFATALLTTQPHVPTAISEFQAGWLAAPEDPLPRAADPSNTTLALYELLAWGATGVVDFPLQDTLAPFGWEAPFSNALYAWDAAIAYPPPTLAARAAPSARFGALVRAYGPLLASAHRVTDGAVLWPAASMPGLAGNDAIASAAAATEHALEACRAAALACALIDPHAAAPRTAGAPWLVVPSGTPLDAVSRAWLRTYARNGGRVLVAVPVPAIADLGDVTLARLVGPNASFTVAVNWGGAPVRVRDAATGASIALGPRDGTLVVDHVRTGLTLPPLVVPAAASPIATTTPSRDAVALSPHAIVPLAGLQSVSPDEARAWSADAFSDGGTEVVLQNDRVRMILVPQGGARSPVFEDLLTGANAFDATGALRDDVSVPPPPSTSDRIGKWTRSYPAGTFNREVDATIAQSGAHAVATTTLDAPDLVSGSACFARTIALDPHAPRVVVDRDDRFPHAPDERGVVLDALVGRAAFDGDAPLSGDLGAPVDLHPERGGVVVVSADGREAIAVSWPPADVLAARWEPHRSNGTLRLTLAPGPTRVTYALHAASSQAEAARFGEAERAWVVANAPAASMVHGEVAKRYTQSPQKRPSVSSCGFESHLP
jgi:hypothetical protein